MTVALDDRLDQEWRRLSARHRVILRPAGPSPPPAEDPLAIVSRVPEIRVAWPASGLCGRKRTLRLEEDGAWACYRLRLCDPGGAPETAPHLARYARPVRGRPVAVSRARPDSREIQLSVRPTGASFVEGSAGVDPAAFLMRFLLEDAVRAILRHDGEPRVGRDVPARIRALLATGRLPAREAWGGELAIPEGTGSDPPPVPSYLVRRLSTYRALLRLRGNPAPPPNVTDAEVEEETARLRKLVEARALSALRLDETEIRGVLNPEPGSGGDGRPAIGFRLQLGPPPMGPRLTVWLESGTGDVSGRSACLGKGSDILRSFHAAGDVYAMVDTVINYVETNRVESVLQQDGGGVPRRPFGRCCIGGRRRHDRPVLAPA